MKEAPSAPIWLQFLGGAGIVTGSLYLVRAGSHTFLLECGLFQGPRQQARQINSTFPFSAQDVEFLLLSHAHIDHSGNIPTLVRQGFRGKICTTSATADLASAQTTALYSLHRGVKEPESHAESLSRHIRLGHVRIGTDPSSSHPWSSRSLQHGPFRRVSGRRGLAPANRGGCEASEDPGGRIPGPGTNRDDAEFFCPCLPAGSVELCGCLKEGVQRNFRRPWGAGRGGGGWPKG
jgi:hypothetical protein